MLKALMLPAEVKLLKPNPAGCWHCVPAMMHGLAVLCGPSMLFVNGVPAPGKSVSVMAEAAPVRVKVTAAVAAVPTNHCVFMRKLPSLVDRPGASGAARVRRSIEDFWMSRTFFG